MLTPPNVQLDSTTAVFMPLWRIFAEVLCFELSKCGLQLFLKHDVIIFSRQYQLARSGE